MKSPLFCCLNTTPGMQRLSDGMLDCVLYLKYVLLRFVVSPHGVSERMFLQACCVMTARAGHGKCLICDKKYRSCLSYHYLVFLHYSFVFAPLLISYSQARSLRVSFLVMRKHKNTFNDYQTLRLNYYYFCVWSSLF